MLPSPLHKSQKALYTGTPPASAVALPGDEPACLELRVPMRNSSSRTSARGLGASVTTMGSDVTTSISPFQSPDGATGRASSPHQSQRVSGRKRPSQRSANCLGQLAT